MQTSESLAVEPAVQHERLAFRDLVERYKRPVYFFALDLTGNHHDAEDLSQDVFIKAYRALDGFRGEASLKSWLYRITVNTYLNKRRKKALAFMQLWETFADQRDERESLPAPDARAERSTIQQHVDQALERLSPQERTAFVLRHYHECSVREVAETMAVAEGTVKSLLYRAVQKLRKGLAFYRQDLGLEET
jgi:RNA polymerase sigma-70 factor (ECF subfamily)